MNREQSCLPNIFQRRYFLQGAVFLVNERESRIQRSWSISDHALSYGLAGLWIAYHVAHVHVVSNSNNFKK